MTWNGIQTWVFRSSSPYIPSLLTRPWSLDGLCSLTATDHLYFMLPPIYNSCHVKWELKNYLPDAQLFLTLFDRQSFLHVLTHSLVVSPLTLCSTQPSFQHRWHCQHSMDASYMGTRYFIIYVKRSINLRLILGWVTTLHCSSHVLTWFVSAVPHNHVFRHLKKAFLDHSLSKLQPKPS